MQSTKLINSPIWNKFKNWVNSVTPAQLHYVYPRNLSSDINVSEEDCYNFLNELDKEGYASQKLLMVCPKCNQENAIPSLIIDSKYECDECGNVFTPQKYTDSCLIGIVFEIDKKTILSEINSGINPINYIRSGNSISNENNVISLIESNQEILNKPSNREKESTEMAQVANKKIFISHCERDEEIVKRLIKFLREIGVPGDKEHIFCSSLTGYGVPVGGKISDYIKNEFDENILVLFIFTEKYFASAPCLCEMGAVWIKAKKHIPIIVPPFKFEGIKGFIDKDVKGINIIDGGDLFEFKERIKTEFNLTDNNANWETDKEDFLELINATIKKLYGTTP